LSNPAKFKIGQNLKRHIADAPFAFLSLQTKSEINREPMENQRCHTNQAIDEQAHSQSAARFSQQR
jgi:hypothetical protein